MTPLCVVASPLFRLAVRGLSSVNGIKLYASVSGTLDGIGQPTGCLSPVRFMTAVNRAMSRINTRSCTYWRRLRFPLGRMVSGELVMVAARYWKPFSISVSNYPLVGQDLLGILRASCGGNPMRVVSGMQFAAIAHTTAEELETPGTPKIIWLDQDPALGTRIGIAPINDALYWVHFAAWCRVPEYTNAMLELPVVPQAHDAVTEAVLCELTESESDFHRKTFHQEHVALLEKAISALPALTDRVEIMGNNTVTALAIGQRKPVRSGSPNRF